MQDKNGRSSRLFHIRKHSPFDHAFHFFSHPFEGTLFITKFISAIHGCFVPTMSRAIRSCHFHSMLACSRCGRAINIYRVSEIIVQFFIDFLLQLCDINLPSMLFRRRIFRNGIISLSVFVH